ncbi:MAG TPA: hypothetical protein VGB02_11200 [Pyrinomonadaceae bacterium]
MSVVSNSSFNPSVSQTTCRAGPPVLRRAIRRATFVLAGCLFQIVCWFFSFSTSIFDSKSSIRSILNF